MCLQLHLYYMFLSSSVECNSFNYKKKIRRPFGILFQVRSSLSTLMIRKTAASYHVTYYIATRR